MNKVKKLIESILSGKDYIETFNSILAEKVMNKLKDAKKDMIMDMSIKDKKEKMTDMIERELSPDEMKKREEYVKSLKKKMKDFEDRYGDKAKSIMYAIATNLAKGKLNDSVEDIAQFLTKIEEELVGNQHKLDHNKDGKITADDLHAIRSKNKKKQSLNNISKDSKE